MKIDRVLRGGEIVTPDGELTAADIAIGDGRIAGLLKPGEKIDCSNVLDVGGLTVMPGGVDVHIHLGHGADISRPRTADDAAQESAAAAAGGITTFLSYVMSSAPFETIFDEIRTIAEQGARVDFGYHFVIATEEQLLGTPRYAKEFGAPSFKIFMNNRLGEGKRLGLPDLDDGYLLRLCESAAAVGGMVCPHPENAEIARVLRDREMARDPDGKGGLKTWNATRPPYVEAEAVQRAAIVARANGAPIYFVHTSSGEAMQAAIAAKADGGTVFIETCPPYLTHNVDWPGGDIGKINPPLRTQADCDMLWKAILDGHVDTIATDHVHRHVSAKDGGIWKASPGTPGMEVLLPIMLSEGHFKRGLSLGRLASLLSRRPAEIMGMGERKGRIATGYDADFAVVDLKGKTAVSNATVRSSASYSIYDGWELRSSVVHTIVRGASVIENGELVEASRGTGRYIHRRLPG